MLPVSSARVRTLGFILGGLALGSCGSGQEKLTPASETGIELFLQPAKSLYLEPNMQLGALLERYAQRMGWTLLASESVRAKLAARHCNDSEPLEVPFGSVHGFVESLVCENGLLLRFEHREIPVVLQVIDPEDKEQGDIPAHRVLVPAAEVPRWEAHPAHMITTQLPLPAGDADLLVRNLRAILGEAARGQVIQTGDTKSVLLSGTGTEVARLARIIDEAARGPGKPDALPPALPDRPKWIDLLHTPSKPLHLEQPEHREPTLQALVDAYAQLMGWRLLYGLDTRNQLRTLKCGLALPLDVPAENVHAFVEGVLSTNDFVLRFAHAQEPVLLGIDSTTVAGRTYPLNRAYSVPPAELPRWAAHPAFQITTCFELPGVDVRTLSNSMRQMFSDQQTQQIIPVGNANGLIVTGYGSGVAEVAAMLHTLVDAAAGVHISVPALPARPSGVELLVSPARGLHLEKPERRELRLFDVFDQYAQLMGWNALADPATRNELVLIKCPFTLPLDVPPENVHAFVEGVARANDVVFSFAHTRAPVMLQVTSLSIAGRNNPRKDASPVPVSELAPWAAHPAFLITTCLDLPGIDVRTLSNSLRQMFSDQQTQQIIPVGNTDGLIVTGYGSGVAEIASMLRSLSNAAAGSHVAPPPMTQGESGIGLLVTPPKGLHFEKPVGRELKLDDVFEQYSELMGWHVLAGMETRSQLNQIPCGFTPPLDVSPDYVHTFVESIARANDFVFTFAHVREPVLLVIASTRIVGLECWRTAAPVPPSELSRWAAHPAFLISTSIDLPGLDARTLSDSLRQMFIDQQTQRVIPLGDTNGLLLAGFGNEIATIAASLGELSRGGSALTIPVGTAPPAADRMRLFPFGAGGFALEAPDGREATSMEVLEAFAKWTKRPIEISEEARLALMLGQRKLASPRVIPAELVHPYLGLLLERAHCTLSPVPSASPSMWIVDVERVAKDVAVLDVPTVPFEELTAWSGYCATPFRSSVRLPEAADPRLVQEAVSLVVSPWPGVHAQLIGPQVLQLVGTPRQIQAAAYAILQACEPTATKPR